MLSTPRRARRSTGTPKGQNFTDVTTGAVPAGFELESTNHDVFDFVPGRLTMANEQVNYRVTTEEMRRRLDGVEQMNSSSLACNLKRTKDNGGGERLRGELERKGIDIVRNRRQCTFTNNSIMALTEAETLHLARDLEEVCEEIYPVADIANEVFEEADGFSKEELENFGFCMNTMSSVFASVVPPISGICPKASECLELNRGMERASHASHGFAIVSQPNWLRQITLIGKQMEKIAKKEEEAARKDG